MVWVFIWFNVEKGVSFVFCGCDVVDMEVIVVDVIVCGSEIFEVMVIDV